MKGTIKSTGRGGFGFIDTEDGRVLFFHASALLPSSPRFETLTRGQAVVFEPQDSAKGPRATQVIAEAGTMTIRASAALAPDDL